MPRMVLFFSFSSWVLKEVPVLLQVTILLKNTCPNNSCNVRGLGLFFISFWVLKGSVGVTSSVYPSKELQVKVTVVMRKGFTLFMFFFFLYFWGLKGTVEVTSNEPLFKEIHTRFTKNIYKLLLVFFNRKLVITDSS